MKGAVQEKSGGVHDTEKRNTLRRFSRASYLRKKKETC